MRRMENKRKLGISAGGMVVLGSSALRPLERLLGWSTAPADAGELISLLVEHYAGLSLFAGLALIAYAWHSEIHSYAHSLWWVIRPNPALPPALAVTEEFDFVSIAKEFSAMTHKGRGRERLELEELLTALFSSFWLGDFDGSVKTKGQSYEFQMDRM